MTTRLVLGAAILLVVIVAGAMYARALRGVPPIHDISTDTNDPPLFVDVLPLRAGAKNSAAYGGSAVAELQRAAYPDIASIDLTLTPATAFARARDVASAMEWTIVSADSSAGRIEATATTRWLRFKDDVVIRIRPRDGGCRVDVRSVSRVGRSDLGKNASRIREFSARLRGGTGVAP